MGYSSIEIRLKQYYQKEKIAEKTKFEIDILNNNNEILKEHIDNEIAKKKIIENNKKIIEKTLEINDIAEENSDIKFILSLLEDEERKLIEVRYKKNKKYQPMSDIFNMSASTISRKLNRTINKIGENMEEYREL